MKPKQLIIHVRTILINYLVDCKDKHSVVTPLEILN